MEIVTCIIDRAHGGNGGERHEVCIVFQAPASDILPLLHTGLKNRTNNSISKNNYCGENGGEGGVTPSWSCSLQRTLQNVQQGC